MKLLVCGSREFTDQQAVHQALNVYLREHGEDLIVIHGGARGADSIAAYWCERSEVDCLRVPAKWRVHGTPAAGPIRNKRMRDRYKPDAALAFRKVGAANVGTDHMIALLREAGIPVEVVE